jgi:hypothetical protein
MHRITGTYVDPTANGPGKPGFTAGEPGVSGATVITDPWLNATQEEIASVIEALGITLSAGDNAQLLAAIQRLVGATVISPAVNVGDQHNYTPTGWSTAGVVRIDGSGETIFGFGPALVKRKMLVNVDGGAAAFSLSHNSGAETAGNKILTPTGRLYVVRPNSVVFVAYDDTSACWRVVADKNVYSDLVADATFLAGAYNWTAAQQFAAAVTLLSTLQVTGSISTNDVFSGAEYHYSTPLPTRNTFVPLSGFQPQFFGTGNNWELKSLSSALVWNIASGTTGESLAADIVLPHGAVLNSVTLLFDQGASVGSQMQAELNRVVIDTVGPTYSNPAGTNLATAALAGFGANTAVVLTPASPETIDSGRRYQLLVQASNGATSNSFRWALLNWTDPGPRNH